MTDDKIIAESSHLSDAFVLSQYQYFKRLDSLARAKHDRGTVAIAHGYYKTICKHRGLL